MNKQNILDCGCNCDSQADKIVVVLTREQVQAKIQAKMQRATMFQSFRNLKVDQKKELS